VSASNKRKIRVFKIPPFRLAQGPVSESHCRSDGSYDHPALSQSFGCLPRAWISATGGRLHFDVGQGYAFGGRAASARRQGATGRGPRPSRRVLLESAHEQAKGRGDHFTTSGKNRRWMGVMMKAWVCPSFHDKRQEQAMDGCHDESVGLPIDDAIANDLSVVVDGVGVPEIPAGAGRKEILQQRHRAVVP
jgi:hypothetical protein